MWTSTITHSALDVLPIFDKWTSPHSSLYWPCALDCVDSWIINWRALCARCPSKTHEFIKRDKSSQTIPYAPKHFAIGYVRNDNLPLGNIALQYVIQNNCRKIWWCFLMIPCILWRSRKKFLNSPKLSCGFQYSVSIFLHCCCCATPGNMSPPPPPPPCSANHVSLLHPRVAYTPSHNNNHVHFLCMKL